MNSSSIPHNPREVTQADDDDDDDDGDDDDDDDNDYDDDDDYDDEVRCVSSTQFQSKPQVTVI